MISKRILISFLLSTVFFSDAREKVEKTKDISNYTNKGKKIHSNKNKVEKAAEYTKSKAADIKEKAGEVVNSTEQKVKDAAGYIKKEASEAKGKVEDVVSSAKDKLSGAKQKIKNAAPSALADDEWIKAIKGALNTNENSFVISKGVTLELESIKEYLINKGVKITDLEKTKEESERVLQEWILISVPILAADKMGISNTREFKMITSNLKANIKMRMLQSKCQEEANKAMLSRDLPAELLQYKNRAKENKIVSCIAINSENKNIKDTIEALLSQESNFDSNSVVEKIQKLASKASNKITIENVSDIYQQQKNKTVSKCTLNHLSAILGKNSSDIKPGLYEVQNSNVVVIVINTSDPNDEEATLIARNIYFQKILADKFIEAIDSTEMQDFINSLNPELKSNIENLFSKIKEDRISSLNRSPKAS